MDARQSEPVGSPGRQNQESTVNVREVTDIDCVDRDLFVYPDHHLEEDCSSETNSIFPENRIREDELAYFMAGIFVEPFYHNFDDLHTLGPDWWSFPTGNNRPQNHLREVSKNHAHSKTNSFLINPQLKFQKESDSSQLSNPSDLSDRVGCRCKKSKCLRLHCRCFNDLLYCFKNCRCLDCFNRLEHQRIRKFVVEKTIEISPTAFSPKIMKVNNDNPTSLHLKGCTCKSGCNRNYCECFKSQSRCSSLCKCTGCQNDYQAIDSKILATVPRPKRAKGRLSIKTVPLQKPPKVLFNTEDFSFGDTQQEGTRNDLDDTDLRSKNDSRCTDFMQRDTKTIINFENYKRVKLQTLKY
jgi:hypothetical protein